MATQLWLWQNGTSYSDWFKAAARGPDGSSVMAGFTWGSWAGNNAGDRDQVAVKFDSAGEILWQYQSGGEGDDDFGTVSVNQVDESVVLAGQTDGGLTDVDFSIVKLDAEGVFLWEFQDGTSGEDVFRGIPMAENGSVIAVGQTGGDWDGVNAGSDDFVALRLDADGEEIWRYQDGTTEEDGLWAAVMADDDASVVTVGHTRGNFSGVFNGGVVDLVVMKLDVATGTEIWRHQDGTATGEDYFKAIAVAKDGGYLVVGDTEGDWNGASAGDKDFVAVKLSSDGEELWRWQDGSAGEDRLREVQVQADGSILLAGYTAGDWDGVNAGGWDFAMVALTADGQEELWRWQDGSFGDDWCDSMALGSDGTVILAGETDGSWGNTILPTDSGDFVAIMLEMPALATPAPLAMATPAPSAMATPAPSAVATPAPTFSISPAPTPAPSAPSAIVEVTPAPGATRPPSSPSLAPVVDPSLAPAAPTPAPTGRQCRKLPVYLSLYLH